MARSVCFARLLKINDVTPTVKEFHFEATSRVALPDVASEGGSGRGSAGGGGAAVQAADEASASLAFEAGQWLDFAAPGVDVVGGFSLTSTAVDLPRLTLAVKYSGFPPVAWLHDVAAVGDEVRVRVGGDCTLNVDWELAKLEEDTVAVAAAAEERAGAAKATAAAAAAVKPSLHVVLVAGGIGITPLLSMLRHADAWLAAAADAYDGCTPADRAGRRAALATAKRLRVTLLHSAASADELAFREATEAVARRHPSRVRCHFFDTSLSSSVKGSSCSSSSVEAGSSERDAAAAAEAGGTASQTALAAVDGTWRGRISEAVLRGVVSESIAAEGEHLVAFVCGPELMIRDTKVALMRCGCAEDDVRYETWW